MFACDWNASRTKRHGNGQLQLQVMASEKSVDCAEVRTRRRFHYGYFETRLRAERSPGIITGFFTYTGSSNGTQWDEIDIEILGDRTINGRPVAQFNYYKAGSGGHEFVYPLPFDPTADFHRYGFNWQSDYVAFFVDGIEVHRSYEIVPDTPSFLFFNNWRYEGKGNWAGNSWNYKPTSTWIDWVRYES
jgi:beta-glucanase (GH16 family)